MADEADPDVQLMLALQRGELAAFDQLFTKHAPGVVRFAAHFVRSRARAEELAQDVFLQVYRNRHKYVPSARFVTWLYRMTTNACLSEIRRSEHRHRATPVENAEGEIVPPPEPTDGSAEEALVGQRALQRISAVLEALPGQQRAAILLARLEGMSYDEVASALSLSVSAVKSLIHRATVTLRAQLGDLNS